MRVLAIAVVSLACLCFLGCGSRPQDLILGKWETMEEKDKYSVEFTRDGTIKITRGMSVSGKYKFVDNGTIEVEVENPFANAPLPLEGLLNVEMPKVFSGKRQVTVTQEELLTTDAEGKTTKFRRIK
jgi:hypothetical protein